MTLEAVTALWLEERTMTDYPHTTLGRTGIAVHRLGLSGSYWPGRKGSTAPWTKVSM